MPALTLPQNFLNRAAIAQKVLKHTTYSTPVMHLLGVMNVHLHLTAAVVAVLKRYAWIM